MRQFLAVLLLSLLLYLAWQLLGERRRAELGRLLGRHAWRLALLLALLLGLLLLAYFFPPIHLL
ncbi:hypothetical protein [Paucibacter sp. DJ2R-2]|uniref:hypothetical protein n=1 Tax=Paucibacter sp. DJ2R-2 TaxID=2893558 RepID=UPI0021E3BEE7|nr:hypothetical protein [Paucibacter sp. DJ2R-2]MCV2419364.1 hypothetical protein [Paucibacter sp. DJ4R-1]MCV2437732.1 hypothetical protein [Paucibacter sp. DJ2R-2]